MTKFFFVRTAMSVQLTAHDKTAQHIQRVNGLIAV